VALVGFAAFLGHVFPVWLRFKGGKGVATAGAVLIGFDWRLGLAVVVVWLTMAVVSRYSSLAALTAALFAPVAAWYLRCKLSAEQRSCIAATASTSAAVARRMETSSLVR
jgi:acyl-phosphate glycerol 3-phosphate acyltransferase